MKKDSMQALYIGVDMSSIHFKSAKTGATTGFIIGYAFNEKWSIEERSALGYKKSL